MTTFILFGAVMIKKRKILKKYNSRLRLIDMRMLSNNHLAHIIGGIGTVGCTIGVRFLGQGLKSRTGPNRNSFAFPCLEIPV